MLIKAFDVRKGHVIELNGYGRVTVERAEETAKDVVLLVATQYGGKVEITVNKSEDFIFVD